MKLAIFNDNQIGIVENERIYEVTERLKWDKANPFDSFVQLMDYYDSNKEELEMMKQSADSYLLSDVKLQAPVPTAGKIWAAPVNYLKHQEEMNQQFNNAPRTIKDIQLFLKSPSSLSGPSDPITLPIKGRRTDHEAELGFVVGKKARNIKASEAKDYIFGYFALLDISVRGKEERSWRKSFDTFTPIGPYLVTSDEIEDPNNLDFKLWVNEELRQDGNTRHLIYDCYKCLEAVTQNMTVYPGDIIATGTPEGVGPLQEGDNVRIKVQDVGEFTVPVKAGYHK